LAAAVVCDMPVVRLGTDAEPGREDVELAREGGDDVPGMAGGGAVRDWRRALSDRSSFCSSARAEDWDAECFSIICAAASACAEAGWGLAQGSTHLRHEIP